MNDRCRFQNAQFIKAAVWPKDYPSLFNPAGKPLPEVGVAGRSNVGKSSLLNHLFKRKNLVKTSSSPGKTQTLNFFTVDKKIAFVDLPGYGYAKVPDKIKKQWGPMVQSYLEQRPTLQLLLFLLDIRRTPNADDMRLLEWACYMDIPFILILTKTDKVKQNERGANTKKILRSLAYDDLSYLYYSTTKNTGRSQLIHAINESLQPGHPRE